MSLKSDKNNGYSSCRLIYIFDISVLLRMRNVSKVVQKIKTHFYSISFFENPAIYEIWNTTAQTGRPKMTIWRMRTTCWLPKLQTHTKNM